MQSIERYGVIALVFLAVTVVAVIMWDDGDSPTGTVAAAEPNTPETEAHQPRNSDSGLVSLRTDPTRNQGLARDSERRRFNVLQPSNDPSTPPANHGGILPPRPDETPQPIDEPDMGEEVPAVMNDTWGERGEDPPAPTPVPTTPQTYVVKPNETLSQISERELGTWKRWKEIVDLNPGLDPNRLRVGVRLVLPARSEERATTRDTAVVPPSSPGVDDAGKVWTVGEGDNLWKISQQVLGDGARWGEIAKANPGMNVDRLKLGQKINLPAGATPTARPKRDRSVADAKPTSNKRRRVR